MGLFDWFTSTPSTVTVQDDTICGSRRRPNSKGSYRWLLETLPEMIALTPSSSLLIFETASTSYRKSASQSLRPGPSLLRVLKLFKAQEHPQSRPTKPAPCRSLSGNAIRCCHTMTLFLSLLTVGIVAADLGITSRSKTRSCVLSVANGLRASSRHSEWLKTKPLKVRWWLARSRLLNRNLPGSA